MRQPSKLRMSVRFRLPALSLPAYELPRPLGEPLHLSAVGQLWGRVGFGNLCSYLTNRLRWPPSQGGDTSSSLVRSTKRVLRIWYYAFYSSKKGYMMGTTEVRNNTLFGSTVYGQQLSFPSKCAITLGASTIKDEIVPFLEYGSVVELVDTPALGAGPFGGVGSSPTRPTTG